MTDWPDNPYDDQVPDVPTEDVLAEEARYEKEQEAGKE